MSGGAALLRGSLLAMALIMAAACHAQSSVADTLPARIERLAAAGNAEAAYHLGMMYQTGSGLPLNHRMAFAAFGRAAALGDPLAAYKLGCYYAGQDPAVVAADQALALRYKLEAAEAGYALAQQDVAVTFARAGQGARAAAWAERSAAQGWADGLATAASVINLAAGATRDPAKVAAYFQLFLERETPSPNQTNWLATFRATLSDADRCRADDIMHDYHPAPTPLTLKALSGQRAAEALIAGQ